MQANHTDVLISFSLQENNYLLTGSNLEVVVLMSALGRREFFFQLVDIQVLYASITCSEVYIIPPSMILINVARFAKVLAKLKGHSERIIGLAFYRPGGTFYPELMCR